MCDSQRVAAQLAAFIADKRRLLILTGAGISTDSGIPDYRTPQGQRRETSQPVQHREFVSSVAVRQQFWARSQLGWPRMRDAKANLSHRYIAQLQRSNSDCWLITQNVDGLHQRAGSRRIVDIHGRSDRVICLACRHYYDRQQVHLWNSQLNPHWGAKSARLLPDGDAQLAPGVAEGFRFTDCPRCAGVLKPDVVFFGDQLPAPRSALVKQLVEQCDGLLVLGSSLMVYSGFRLCKRVNEQGKPLAALTMGVTRADQLLDYKWSAPLASVFEQLYQNNSA